MKYKMKYLGNEIRRFNANLDHLKYSSTKSGTFRDIYLGAEAHRDPLKGYCYLQLNQQKLVHLFAINRLSLQKINHLVKNCFSVNIIYILFVVGKNMTAKLLQAR